VVGVAPQVEVERAQGAMAMEVAAKVTAAEASVFPNP